MSTPSPLFVKSLSLGDSGSLELTRRGSTNQLLESGEIKKAEYQENLWGTFVWQVAKLVLISTAFCAAILIPLDPPHPSSIAANYKFLIFATIILSYFTLSHTCVVFSQCGYPPTPHFLRNCPSFIINTSYYYPNVILGFLTCFFGAFVPIFAGKFPVPFLFIPVTLIFNTAGNQIVKYQYPAKIRKSEEFTSYFDRIGKLFMTTIVSIFFVDIVSVGYLLVGSVAQIFLLLLIAVVGFLSRYLILYVANKLDLQKPMGALLLSNFITIQFPTVMIMPRATNVYVLIVGFIFQGVSSAWPVLVALFQAKRLNRVHNSSARTIFNKLQITPDVEAKVTFLNFLCNLFSIVLFVPILLFYSFFYNNSYSFFASASAHNLLGYAVGLIIGNSVIAIAMFFISRKLFIKYFHIDPIVIGNEELKERGWAYVHSTTGIVLMTILYMIRHFDIYYYVAKDLYN